MSGFLSKSFSGTIIALLIVPFFYSYSFAQNSFYFKELANLKSTSLFSISDSLKKDSVISHKPSSNKFVMKKSPWGAVLRSALLPGLGQYYNRDYWKIPVILGLMGYLGYEVYNNHQKYSDYREQYANSQTAANPEGNANLKLLRNFYRDQRDEFIWYTAIVYFINLVDAYVGAHLFDFDVKQEKATINHIISPKYTFTIKLPL
jgi:hypothetical protein